MVAGVEHGGLDLPLEPGGALDEDRQPSEHLGQDAAVLAGGPPCG